jgi:hypothetical protein
MMQPDLNFWGWLAMPVGVLFCFGAVIAAWAMSAFDSKTEEGKPKEKK